MRDHHREVDQSLDQRLAAEIAAREQEAERNAGQRRRYRCPRCRYHAHADRGQHLRIDECR